jgi:hypothetical protein
MIPSDNGGVTDRRCADGGGGGGGTEGGQGFPNPLSMIE